MNKERRVCAHIFTNIEIGEDEAAIHDLKQYAKEQVIKELEKLGAELYKKEGTDSYVLRCLIHDKKEELKQK
jgi:transcriptional regulator of NAD metabolism